MNEITKVTFNEPFRDLLKQHLYEKYILLVLQRSKVLLPNLDFRQVKQQFNGECDYTDVNGDKYEAKVIIDEKQGEELGNRRYSFEVWVNDIIDECNQFIRNRNSDVSSLKLYSIMERRLKTIQKDEVGILFFPFRVSGNCLQKSYFSGIRRDVLQVVYDELVENGVVKNKDNYFVYPCREKSKFCLRKSCNAAIVEIIGVPELDSFFTYEKC